MKETQAGPAEDPELEEDEDPPVDEHEGDSVAALADSACRLLKATLLLW
jgi:hypothetical protein